MSLGQDVIERASRPVISDGCSVISFPANAVGGTAESIDDRIVAAHAAAVAAVTSGTKLGQVVALQVSNPAGGAAVWLRNDVLGAASAGAGVLVAAGENSVIYGWQEGNGFLLETDHVVYLMLFRS